MAKHRRDWIQDYVEFQEKEPFLEKWLRESMAAIGSSITGGSHLLIHTEDLLDDGTYAFPVATRGVAAILFGDGEESALFHWSTAGVPTEIIQGVGGIQWTDLDTYYCVYDGGTGVVAKNRKGSTKSMLILGAYV